MGLFKSNDAVAVAQRLIAEGGIRTGALSKSIGAIVETKRWLSSKGPNGKFFQTFATFATTAQPWGLGITAQETMEELVRALHKGRLYGPMRELLEATTRRQGRPKKNLVNDEICFPLFKLPTSHAAPAKQVMLLARKHADISRELEEGHLTLKQAVDKAGLSTRSVGKRLRYGVLWVNGLGALPPNAQGKLLLELFRSVGVDAQCRLLASSIEPALGSGLAGRWRSRFNG